MFKLEYKDNEVSVIKMVEVTSTNYGVYLENGEFLDNSKIGKVIKTKGGYFAYNRSCNKEEFLSLIHTSLEARKNQLRSKIIDITVEQKQISDLIKKEV